MYQHVLFKVVAHGWDEGVPECNSQVFLHSLGRRA